MARRYSPASVYSRPIYSAILVGTELAGEIEAKQIAERLGDCKEAVQVEIGVGQLESLKGEKDTPDAAGFDSEENVSDEALDEIDDSLLEHAMNSGLLNDDDRELFRASIEKMQRRTSSSVFVE